ncbi:MAG: Ig-like domain-containing protein [Caldilineaceae bacterium]
MFQKNSQRTSPPTKLLRSPSALALLLAALALLGLPKAAQAASFTAAGATLTLNLAAAESVTMVTNGATYTLILGGAATWNGTDSANVSGNGTNTLAVSADAFTEINISDSGAGASVTFGNSGANAFSASVTVVLDAGSSMVTVTNSVSFVDGSSLAVTADTLTVNATLSTANNADITLRANVMDIGAAVSAGTGIVTLAPRSNGRLIDLGSTTDVAANTLELSDAEIDRSTAGILRIGSSTAGSITFSNLISLAGSDTLTLITGDEIVDAHTGADVQVTNLALQAVNGIADSGNTILDTDVETVAARNTGNGGISIVEIGLNSSVTGKDLIVGAVDGVVGIRNEASTGPAPTLGIQLETTDGDLTVNSDIFNQRRNIFLVAQQGNGSTGDSLFINNANINAAASNSEIRIDANNMTLANGSTISAPSRVRLNDDPGSTVAIAINVGGMDGVNTLGLTDAELSTVSTSGVLQIGSTKTGPIDVTAPIDLTDGPNIPTTNLISGTAILGSGGNVFKANALNLSAGSTIGASGDPFAFNATALTTAGNGDQYLAAADSVTVGNNDLDAGTGHAILLNGGAFVTTGNGAIQNNTTVMTDASLMGTGVVNGAVTVQSGGELAPGASPGIINTGNTTFNAGATFTVEINGVTSVGSDYDQLNVNGSVTIDPAANLVATGTITGTNGGDTVVLINNDGSDAVTGNFAGLPNGTTIAVNGQDFRIFYAGGDGNDVVLVRNDSTPPVITPNISGTLGDNGWYTSDVTVTWTVTDSESAISGSSGCSATTVNSDTAGTTLTCEAASEGGTNSVSVTIKRDTAPPAANAGGPYGVKEGGSVQLDAGSTVNNGPATEPLTYGWDFDGDGQYDDATVITPTFSAAALDGPSVVTIGLLVTDGGGLTDTVTTTVSITNVTPIVNAGPDQSVFRNETVNLSSAWSDPAGAADNAYGWSWDLDGDGNNDDSGSASYGATITGTTRFTVTGVITLTFTVTDKDGGSGDDTVQITVTNRAPLADSQNLSTTVETALPVTLSGADEDGDAIGYTLVSQPSHGALSGVVPNLTYTPNAGFIGSDSFTFVVNDGLAGSNVAVINIAVDSVNSPPLATDDGVTTSIETPVRIDVAANDSDVDGNLDPATVTPLTTPAQGALVNHDDGSFTYTPAPNYVGDDSFQYQICDSDDACATATVRITVTAVNDAPVCDGAAPSVSTLSPPDLRLVPVTINGVSDGDGDAIAITIDSIFQDEPVVGAADGQGIGTATAQLRAERADSGNGRTYHIAFTARDGNGGFCSGVVRVSVTVSEGGAAIDDGALYDSTMAEGNPDNTAHLIFLPLVSNN